jgi:RNA polymerase sigma factor FliA
MRLFDKGSWDPKQTSLSAPPGRLTKLNLPDSTELKPPNDPSAAAALPRPGALLTADQERVMIEHLPLVRIIALHIHDRLPQQVPVEDLYSAGTLGLLDAFGRFDPSKQVLFRTYAQFRIRGAILDSLRTLDWSPRDLRRKGRAVEQAIQLLTAQLHRSPTDLEIAQKLNIPLASYQQLLGELNGLQIDALDSLHSTDPDEEEPIYLTARPEDDPLFRYLDGEMRDRLAKAIDDLPERERLVMTLYYYEEITMKDIGLIIGVVDSRVCQLHASGVLHLRARLAPPATIEESRHDETLPERSPRG